MAQKKVEGQCFNTSKISTCCGILWKKSMGASFENLTFLDFRTIILQSLIYFLLTDNCTAASSEENTHVNCTKFCPPKKFKRKYSCIPVLHHSLCKISIKDISKPQETLQQNWILYDWRRSLKLSISTTLKSQEREKKQCCFFLNAWPWGPPPPTYTHTLNILNLNFGSTSLNFIPLHFSCNYPWLK